VVKPYYPSTAKATHLEGDVQVEVEVDPSGHVIGTQVLSGPLPLQGAALDAIKRWKFEPATRDGQPVAGKTMVRLKFLLP
jgi:protein TonB